MCVPFYGMRTYTGLIRPFTFPRLGSSRTSPRIY
nr:MAG TPA_asm: hypothetical protein [Caudoviricetes sp.]